MLQQTKLINLQMYFALSNSFSVYGYVEEEDKETEADLFLSTITAKTCQTCFKKINAG